MKKAISVVMAFAMLLCCFSTLAFAEVKDNYLMQIEVRPTSENYKKGDIVTFEVFYETSAYLELLGETQFFTFGYDKSVFEPIEDLSSEVTLTNAKTIIYKGYPVEGYFDTDASMIRGYETGVSNPFTAVDAAKNWDGMFFGTMTYCGKDPADDYSSKKASFAFQLRIKEDAADDGNYSVGITDYAIQNGRYNVSETWGGISGPSGPDMGFDGGELPYVENVFDLIDGTVKMAPVEAPFMTHPKSQIRFTTEAGAYANKFDYRYQVKMDGAKFEAMFGATPEAQAAAIKDIGFVLAPAKTAFNLDVAKAEAMGADAAGYVDMPVTKISTTENPGAYTFACLVTEIGAPYGDGTNMAEGFAYALPYIASDANGDGNVTADEYIFLDAVINENFNAMYAKWFPEYQKTL